MRISPRYSVVLILLLALAVPGQVRAADPTADGVTLRFYQGVVAYVNNPEGKDFDISIAVREWNLVENGPREVLVKVYDPDGHSVVRTIVPDDGVVGDAFMPEAGGWDHEMWYYMLNYGTGSVPMFRWSSLTEPTRVARLQARDFTYPVAGGKKGVYRVQLMASRDHVVTLKVGGDLKYSLAGHPMWMHGHHDMFKASYIYVPRGTIAMHLAFAEYDQPVTRTFKLTAPDGEVIWETQALGGLQNRYVTLDPAGKYDDQVLKLEVSDGAGDYLLHVQLGRNDVRLYRGKGGAPALFSPDEETARATQGGAIYHDGKVFWHGFQVRLHDWLQANITDADCIVKDAEGNTLEPVKGSKYGWNAYSMVYKGLPENPDYIALNGGHEAPPISDYIMHHYSAHKQRAALNVALRDLYEGLRMITVGDQVVIGGYTGNLGYVFGTYGWHYWRPAWRIVQDSDAPEEVKAIIREAFIVCGDRIAFARGIERTNGNAFSHIPMALAYATACTEDPMLAELSRVYLDRFRTGGWGKGAGISPSGDCQEHFAHDFHYGTYIFANYRAVINDLHDKQFQELIDRDYELYTYLYCPGPAAYPWGARTAQQAGIGSGPNWKGNPGPDFTVNVNDGGEWFAARRANYYALTFHGNLAPSWLNHYFGTKIGYGGGILCQVTVPGRGPVLASTLNGSYGKKMQLHLWEGFNIQSIVGTMADGRPLVAADSIHQNAKLEGNTVSSSGEVRDRPIHVTRSYVYEDDYIQAEVSLADTWYRAAYAGKGESSVIREAYEMIPYYMPKSGKKPAILLITPTGEMIPATDALQAAAGLVVNCDGYGVKILLDEARPVKLGTNATFLVSLAAKPTRPDAIRFSYKIIPYIGEPDGSALAVTALPLTEVGPLKGLDDVAAALAEAPVHVATSDKVEVARVRAALAAGHLVVSADIVDAGPKRHEKPWKASSFEVFASEPGSTEIGQVFLLPAVDSLPDKALVSAKDGPLPAPDIQLRTTTIDDGYRAEAIIPLAQLKLPAGATSLTLEFQFGTFDATMDLRYATVFNSVYAYQDNRRYGFFRVPGTETAPAAQPAEALPDEVGAEGEEEAE